MAVTSTDVDRRGEINEVLGEEVAAGPDDGMANPYVAAEPGTAIVLALILRIVEVAILKVFRVDDIKEDASRDAFHLRD